MQKEVHPRKYCVKRRQDTFSTRGENRASRARGGSLACNAPKWSAPARAMRPRRSGFSLRTGSPRGGKVSSQAIRGRGHVATFERDLVQLARPYCSKVGESAARATACAKFVRANFRSALGTRRA